ncbi:MAG: hypothetical protein ACRBBQ_07815 [Cognatishimia sp.]
MKQVFAHIGPFFADTRQNHAEDSVKQACYCITQRRSFDLSQEGRGFAALFGMEGMMRCV